MKVSVFTGRLSDPQRIDAVREAAKKAVQKKSKLLLLPGYSLGEKPIPKSLVQQMVVIRK